MNKMNGILENMSEKTNGLMIDGTWYGGKKVYQYAKALRGEKVEYKLDEEKKEVVFIKGAGTIEEPQPKEEVVKSYDDSRRESEDKKQRLIVRQACNNAAINIIDIAIRQELPIIEDKRKVGDKALELLELVKNISEDLEKFVYR